MPTCQGHHKEGHALGTAPSCRGRKDPTLPLPPPRLLRGACGACWAESTGAGAVPRHRHLQPASKDHRGASHREVPDFPGGAQPGGGQGLRPGEVRVPCDVCPLSVARSAAERRVDLGQEPVAPRGLWAVSPTLQDHVWGALRRGAVSPVLGLRRPGLSRPCCPGPSPAASGAPPNWVKDLLCDHGQVAFPLWVSAFLQTRAVKAVVMACGPCHLGSPVTLQKALAAAPL